jgi:colanic acid/amylovoran biosynthesis glycosyltransferase
MRIAFFVDAFPVISETFILNQITGLIDRGHTVDVFARSHRHDARVHADIERYGLMDRTRYLDAGGSRLERIAAAARLLCSPAWATRAGVAVLANVIRHHGKTPPFNTLSVIQIASRTLEVGAYDIIHCQYGTLGRTVLRLARIGVVRGRLVTSFRGHDITQRDKFSADFYADLFRGGDLFMPVSRSLEARLLEIGAPQQKIAVHHSGIDCGRFRFVERTCAKDAPMIVITVARLVEMKGVAYGIQGVAKLLQSGRRLTYHIVGGGPLRESLQQLIESLGVAEHVHLHGPKSNDDVLAMFDSAHVMLAPSVTAANGEAEGIPNAVKEAMAKGMPVVATRHSGIPELVDDSVTGYLVPERDAAALAQRLDFLYANRELWPAMGRAARIKVETEFDKNALNDELVRLYATVATRPAVGT